MIKVGDRVMCLDNTNTTYLVVTNNKFTIDVIAIEDECGKIENGGFYSDFEKKLFYKV